MMKAELTRADARVLPEKNGMKDVITALSVGMKLTDESSGLSISRSTLHPLPDPDEADFIPFEDIEESWVVFICEKVAADNDWEASMTAGLEAAKSKPILKPFSFPKPKIEA